MRHFSCLDNGGSLFDGRRRAHKFYVQIPPYGFQDDVSGVWIIVLEFAHTPIVNDILVIGKHPLVGFMGVGKKLAVCQLVECQKWAPQVCGEKVSFARENPRDD